MPPVRRAHLRPRPTRRWLALLLAAAGPLFAAPDASAITAVDPSAAPVTGRVIGGARVGQDAMWPWVVHLATASSSCGGSLIAHDVVLTAAHCVAGEQGTFPAAAWTVTAGRADLRDGASGETARVSEIVVHPAWDAATFRHDVALLHLDRSLNRPVARLLDPSAPLPYGTVLRLQGWGRTDRASEAVSLGLKSVDQRVLDDTSCEGEYARVRFTYDRRLMLCGSSGSLDHAMCDGDSGSPVMQYDAGHGWLQVGLASWGTTDCGATGKPDVYTWTHGAALSAWVLAEGTRLATGAGAAPPAGAAQSPVPSGMGTQATTGAAVDVAAPSVALRVRGRGHRGLRIMLAADEPVLARVTIRQRGRTVLRRTAEIPAAGTVIDVTKLRPGAVEVSVRAADVAGNRSALVRASARVRR